MNLISICYVVVFYIYQFLRKLHPLNFFKKGRSVAPKSNLAVLITGTSSGIGKEVSQDLNRKGFTVFVGLRKLADFKSADYANTSNVIPIQLDVTNDASIKKAYEAVSKWISSSPENKLVGLVNNAGVAAVSAVELENIKEVRDLFEVNFFGVWKVTQTFLPFLKESKGRIVNVSSISGFAAIPLMASYCASKYALEGFSDALRSELYSTGVKVIAIQPGTIRTAALDKSDIPEVHEINGTDYEQLYFAAQKSIKSLGHRASDVEIVSPVVYHALTSSIPETRYKVGIDACLIYLFRQLLSDEWFDKFILSAFGLNHKNETKKIK